MKKILLRTQIKREQGKLYFCGTDEDGNLMVCETEMKRGRKEKLDKK